MFRFSFQCELESPPEVHWLHIYQNGWCKFLQFPCPTVAHCEAPGSLNGLKIAHNNLTYPHYLVVKQEVPPVYTFNVKNIQKSELRPLHKFEQVAFTARVIPARTKLYFSIMLSTDPSNPTKSTPVWPDHDSWCKLQRVFCATYTHAVLQVVLSESVLKRDLDSTFQKDDCFRLLVALKIYMALYAWSYFPAIMVNPNTLYT